MSGGSVVLLGARAAVTLPPLTVAGQFFRAGGERFTVIQASDFSLFKRFLDGEDIRPITDQRRALGFNTLRVWLLNRSVVVNGGIHPADYPGFYESLSRFVEAIGLYVELTVFTSTQGLMANVWDQQQHLDRTPGWCAHLARLERGRLGSAAARCTVGLRAVSHERPAGVAPEDGA
jgi:hypothetical protein